jgi:hypothetical protein
MGRILVSLLQTCLLLVALVWLAIGDFNLQLQIENIDSQIGQLSTYLFIPSTKLMSEIEAKLKEKEYVVALETASNKEVIEHMTAEYGLDNISQLVDFKALPNVLEFRLAPSKSDLEKLSEIIELIAEYKERISYNLPQVDFESLFTKKEHTEIFRLILQSGGAFILALLTLLLSMLNLNKHYHKKSEEEIGTNNGWVFSQTLILSLLPSITLFAGWYFTSLKNIYSLNYNRRLVLITCQLIACLTAWLYAKRVAK